MRKWILFFVIIPLFSIYTQENGGYSRLMKKNESYFQEAVRLRRHLHQIPEPCYQEEMTSSFVADYLKNLGLEVVTDIGGKRGIKAVLEGAKATPVVGIRADMDALPITEETGLEWSSKHSGLMHACGHDIHMTNGLLAARMLSELREEIPGSVVFVFQPCEEGTSDGSPSGASMLVEAGILENPKIDAMFGLHVMPGYPIGSVALREGPIMANVTTIKITIHGKASHGAYPHQGVDAIYAASAAIMQFQSIISRIKDPKEKAVISIGKISGGVRMNVIAERVDMEGTVRSFSFETERLIEESIEKVLKGLAVSHGITYDYQFLRGSKFVKNDSQLTAATTALFKNLLGDENVHITEPVTVGEDFSQYSHAIPSFYFFLGAGMTGSLHHPQFAPDDEILKYGGLLLASAALRFLEMGGSD